MKMRSHSKFIARSQTNFGIDNLGVHTSSVVICGFTSLLTHTTAGLAGVPPGSHLLHSDLAVTAYSTARAMSSGSSIFILFTVSYVRCAYSKTVSAVYIQLQL